MGLKSFYNKHNNDRFYGIKIKTPFGGFVTKVFLWLLIILIIGIFKLGGKEGQGKIYGLYYGGISDSSELIFEGDTVTISWCPCDLILVDKEKNIYQIKNCRDDGKGGCRISGPRDYYEGRYVYEFWNEYLDKYCVRIGPSFESVLKPGKLNAYCKK